MGKYLVIILMTLLCIVPNVCTAQPRRLTVLQPMSVPGYRPHTVDSHEWYWSSPDGRRLVYIDHNANGEAMVADGVAYPRYPSLLAHEILLGPSGQLVYVIERNGKERVIADNRQGPAFDLIDQPIFSPDGKHLAYIAEANNRKNEHVVADGQQGPVYKAIENLYYTQDGRLFYSARRGEKEYYTVLNGQVSGPYTAMSSEVVISPDSRHIAYWINRNDDSRMLVVDGKEGPTYGTAIEYLTYSPDSRHLAYIAAGDKWYLVMDGKKIAGVAGMPYYRNPFNGPLVFSSDSTHIACTITQGKRSSLLLDGGKVAEADRIIGLQFCNGRLSYQMRDHRRTWLVVGTTKYPPSLWYLHLPNDYPWIACYRGRWQTFFDGTEGEPDNLYRGLTCSSNGRHWAYPTYMNRRQAMVIDGQVGPRFRAVGVPFFSPNNRRLAYPVLIGNQFAIVVDGKRGRLYRSVGTPEFSQDNNRVAYPAYTSNGAAVVIDGKSGAPFSEILGKGYLWNAHQLTFDTPTRLHYLARQGHNLYYVRDYLLPAPSPSNFTYYNDGFVTISRRKLRQLESNALCGGHMPWRQDALTTAQAMGMTLLPTIPSGKIPTINEWHLGKRRDIDVASGRWKAVFRWHSGSTTRTRVDVIVNGRRWYQLTLERPFKARWYLTTIKTTL